MYITVTDALAAVMPMSRVSMCHNWFELLCSTMAAADLMMPHLHACMP
jgi:hypothetical protein